MKVESVDLYVSFVPKATTDEVSTFLRAHEANIVDGPKGPGTYRVRFKADGARKDEVARLLKEMQQNRGVVSSEELQRMHFRRGGWASRHSSAKSGSAGRGGVEAALFRPAYHAAGQTDAETVIKAATIGAKHQAR
jgi:hypothetical protein